MGEVRNSTLEAAAVYTRRNCITMKPIQTATSKAKPSSTKIHHENKDVSVQCETCNKVYASRRALHTHELIHRDVKPYKCKHCGKRFRQSSTLKTHARVHTGERPYACTECNKRFAKVDSFSATCVCIPAKSHSSVPNVAKLLLVKINY
ncbi:hypothetical protein AAVH_32891, partial [Aphelenchoides avenae]